MNKLNFADFVTNLMKEKGETSVELSAQIGVPVTTLKSWFQRNSFPADALKKLAQRFRLPTEMYELQQRFEVKVARTSRVQLDSAESRPEFSDAMPIPVDGPMDFPHWAFVERSSTELEALRLLDKEIGHPIGIVGGPKTGKSSAMRFLAQELVDRRHVAEVDLAELAKALANVDDINVVGDELAEALDVVLRTFNPDKRLRGIDKLGPWLASVMNGVLSDKPLLLLLDGVEHLPKLAYQQLSSALFNLRNYINKFALRRLDIVYTFDPVVQKKQEEQDTTGSSILMGRFGVVLDIAQFGDTQIETLLESAFKPRIEDQHLRKKLIRKAHKAVYENGVHGQPYLTQVWLKAFLELWPVSTENNATSDDLDQKFERAAKAGEEAMLDKFRIALKDQSDGLNKTLPYFARDKIVSSSFRLDFEAVDSDEIECCRVHWTPPKSEADQMYLTALRHSCYFYDRQPLSICTTRWLANQFKLAATVTA